MKALVHYTPKFSESVASLEATLPSIEAFGWEVEVVEGLTADDVNLEEHPILPNSYLSKDGGWRQRTKLACSLNHYRFWKRVVDSGNSMAFIEHDVLAINPPVEPLFEVEYLAAEFCIPRLKNYFRFMHSFVNREEGATPIRSQNYQLRYLNNNPYLGGFYLPNTSAYSCTPQGAKRLIDAFDRNGAEHSDLQINTTVVFIGVRTPSLFKHLENPHTSSGNLPAGTTKSS